MVFKRSTLIKEIYEQCVLEDLYKKADLEEELLGGKPAKEPKKEEPYEDEDVDELARELLGDEAIPAKSKEKPRAPVVPHRIPDPQQSLFPEAPRGTKEKPSQISSGEIMGRVCPVCGLKNFPAWIKECERCSKLYKKMRNLIEYNGYTEEEAIELVAKENKSFVGPTALKEIYERGGDIALPDEVEELEFTDRRGLSGTPNTLKLKKVLDTQFNIEKDQFDEPIFTTKGLPIPLDRKDRTHIEMNEIAKKLLLSDESFLEYIDRFNEGKSPKEQIGPAYKLNDDLQIFRWEDVKPALEDRIKELQEVIFPQQHIERLHKKIERHVERFVSLQKTAEYWKERQNDLRKEMRDRDKNLSNGIKNLFNLRKKEVDNKERASLENSFGKLLNEYITNMRRLKSLEELAESRAASEKQNEMEGKQQLVQYRKKIGKPVSEELLTLLGIEEAQEGLDIDELSKSLMGKESRIQLLNSILKLSAEPKQTSMLDLIEKQEKKEKFERETDKEEAEYEKEIRQIMKNKGVSREEAAEEVPDADVRFTPPTHEFVPPKERELVGLSDRECPYCGEKKIFEGSDKCDNCKFPVDKNKRFIVVKRKLWAMIKDKAGNVVINEETGKPKRRPIPFFSLVTVTLGFDGEPISASVKKVADVPVDMGAKTRKERESLYTNKPKINVPKSINMGEDEFRVNPDTGEKTHKQQVRGGPEPWVQIPVNKFDEYKETTAALAYITGEPLPDGTEAWDLKEVANVKGPMDKVPFRQLPTILPTGSTRLERIYALGLLD